jgi:hypothetical protein
MQVDAVQQWSANLPQITLNDPSGTPACMGVVAKETARTPVQISTALEHEPRMPAEGDQRLGACQAPVRGQLEGSSGAQRPRPAVSQPVLTTGHRRLPAVDRSGRTSTRATHSQKEPPA